MSAESSADRILARLGELEATDRDSFDGDEVARTRALVSARALCTRLERPWDFVRRALWLDAPLNTAIKISIDMGLFAALQKSPQTTQQLATSTGSDMHLIRRVMHLLLANDLVMMTDRSEYAALPLGNAFATRADLCSGIDHLFDVLQPAYTNLPRYLAKSKYVEPTNPMDGPWQSTSDSTLSYFEWLAERPREANTFHAVMQGYTSERIDWLSVYPTANLFENLTTNGSPESQVILVDVGGGVGQDLERLHRAHVSKPGRLVLQDQAGAIERVNKEALPDRITVMAHDFFTEQPVKNARAYYLHQVLHNWQDDKAAKILQRQKPAMIPNETRLLLNEIVLTADHPHPFCAAADLLMMSLFSSRERTAENWHRLIESVGLKVAKIWSRPEVPESVIEVIREE